MTEKNIISSAIGRNGIFAKSSGVTLCEKVRSCEIRKVLNVESLLESRGPSYSLVGPCYQNAPGKIVEANPACYTHAKKAHRSSKNQVVWLHLRPCLFPSCCGANRTIRKFLKPWGISSPPRAAVPVTLPRGKAGMKINDKCIHDENYQTWPQQSCRCCKQKYDLREKKVNYIYKIVESSMCCVAIVEMFCITWNISVRT